MNPQSELRKLNEFSTSAAVAARSALEEYLALFEAGEAIMETKRDEIREEIEQIIRLNKTMARGPATTCPPTVAAETRRGFELCAKVKRVQQQAAANHKKFLELLDLRRAAISDHTKLMLVRNAHRSWEDARSYPGPNPTAAIPPLDLELDYD